MRIKVKDERLARILGISARRVREIGVKISQGKYDLEESVKQYIEQAKLGKELSVNQKELSEILGITHKSIRNLTEKKILIADKDGNYDIATNVQRYMSSNDESMKLKRVQREMKELDLMERRNQLHETKVVEEFILDMIMAFRSKCLSLPGKLGKSLIGATNRADIEEITKEEINNILTELSEETVKNHFGGENEDKQ
ncbi:hypothetical protein [Ilyobacter polytropus]|uniref:Uncharacterized protein n=1 Tax=Ilyobacter polytropus (strain ATCC 51220 / DSM 2926 / LMG 16218 / CuHBu1) TaxID=572544 RepID=E3HBM8_ILYPC|nr:hypothetical protein [Ilyobacter polytropus]ADO83724.1 hypothetical protein Ilyop_1953 [Ilyobacter polytropus DSM 2926]